VVPKVLHKAFGGIFNARFLKNKKTFKKRKKRGKNKKRKKRFYIYPNR